MVSFLPFSLSFARIFDLLLFVGLKALEFCAKNAFWLPEILRGVTEEP